MSSFDVNEYFSRRAGNPITDKQSSVKQSVDNKYAALDARANEIKAKFTQHQDSWAGKLGLDADSIPGGIVNLGASFASGASRVAGQIAQLPVDVMTASIESQLSEEDIQAYNRYISGKGTKEDEARLTVSKQGKLPTIQLIQQAQESRNMSRNITDTFDQHSIVSQQNRDGLTNDLGDEFQGAWDQTKQGWDKLGQDGNLLSGLGDIASGVGKLAYNAGEAAVTNPLASSEYIVENIPQLGLGVAGKVGKAALTASNMGYGSELYQEGVENYKKANNGQLPPEEVRQDMALHAASAVLAEQAGDLASLGAMKLAKKGVDEVTRTGFKESLKNIAKAGAQGVATESATEGFQTYAEGEATLKPASAQDIYVGAAIGGIAGGGLTGGGRALAEVAGATPEQVAKKQEVAQERATLVENAKANNPDVYLQEGTKEFDPAKAMAVLYAHNQAEDTTPETKQENFDKAHDIVAGLEKQRDGLQKELDSLTPEGIKKQIAAYEERKENASPANAAKIDAILEILQEDLDTFDAAKVDPKAKKALETKLSQLDRHIAQSSKLRDRLTVESKPQETDVVAAVERADTTPEPKAAQHVISLAMAHPDSLTNDQIDRLVANTSNSLNPVQREYLRSMSLSRIAENALKGMSVVNNEVLNGDKSKNQLGIRDYKQRMQAALLSGDEQKADTALNMLGKFAASHEQKLNLLESMFAETAKGGSRLVIPTKQGWQLAPDQTMPFEKLRKEFGGLKINRVSTKLMANVRAERAALVAAQQQLQSAYALKFNQGAVAPALSTGVNTVVESTSPKSQVSLDTSTTKSTVEGQTQYKVDSSVDPKTESTTPAVQPEAKKVETPVVESEKQIETPLVEEVAQSPESREAPVVEIKQRKVPSHRIVDPAKDSLFKAIAKLGGISTQTLKDIGVDLNDVGYTHRRVIKKGPNAGNLTKPILRSKLLGFNMPLHRKNGMTLDELIEALAQYGYISSTAAERDMEQLIKDELNEPTVSTVEQRILDMELRAIEEAEYYANYQELTDEEAAYADMFAGDAYENPEEYEELLELTDEQAAQLYQAIEQDQAPSEASANQDSDSGIEEGAEDVQVSQEPNGQLSVFQTVIDFAGKKFAEVFRDINLVAHNLTQKLGKDKKTQRPLVAVKDFLDNWEKVNLATFIGEEPNAVQRSLLNHFHHVAKSWMGPITDDLVIGRVVTGNKLMEELKKIKQLPEDKQKEARKEFNKKVEAFKNDPTHVDSKYFYQNPIQFLLFQNELTGKADMEQNVKTALAVAAYTHVAENASAPVYHTVEDVKSIFGLDEHDPIDNSLVDKVSPLGSPEKAIINSLGQRAIEALGISAKPGASKEFLSRLQADLGAHALKLLVSQGVMERNEVTAYEIAVGLAEYREKPNAKQVTNQGNMHFVRMARTGKGALHEQKLNTLAKMISENVVGTKGVLGSLFGVETQKREPSWEPINTVQKRTDNTDQEVPSELAKIVKHENGVANHVRQDVWDIFYMLSNTKGIDGNQFFLDMAGYQATDHNTMHHTTISSIDVKNEGLQRELDTFKNYVDMLMKPENQGGSPLGLDQPLYLSHSVWKQQRVGIDSTINPQSSKIHRWMLTRDAWKTKVSSENTDLMNSFHLRVAEGLGVKTDKQGNVASLKDALEIFNTNSTDEKTQLRAEKLQKAVDALVAAKEGQMSAEQAQAIRDGVLAGGEKMHSLDALIARAEYQQAMKAAGKGKPFEFTVQLMGEVDGVTNGPMISHLLLGAGAGVNSLFNRLNKGGFYRETDGYQNYNVWRGVKGEVTHRDLYEATIGVAMKFMAESDTPKTTADALYSITGQLSSTKGDITKDGRNIIKKPLTAMLFGSNLKGAVEGMFQEFLEKSYTKFEAIAKIKDGHERDAAIEDHIKQLRLLIAEGVRIHNMPTEKYKPTSNLVVSALPDEGLDYYLAEFSFTPEHVQALRSVFNNTLGDAVQKTMKQEFASFLDARDTVNSAANTTFDMYNAAYTGIRQSVLKELTEKGEIPYFTKEKTGEKVPLSDLTPEQEKLIDDRVASLYPTVHTYMSKHSKNGDTSGLLMAKTDREISKEEAYKNTSQFRTPLPDMVVNNDTKQGAVSLINSGYQRTMAAPGVAMIPMLTHSLDSAISHLALMGRQVLNVHDAHGTGVKEFIETAQALNAATWKTILNYSPAAEVRDSFQNTLLSMDALLQGEDNLKVVKPEMLAVLKKMAEAQAEWVYGEKVVPSLDQVLITEAHNIYGEAHRADRTKYEAMSQMFHVDQYALEGGQYDVTPEDRAEALKRFNDLGKNPSLPGSMIFAIDRINQAILGASAREAVNHRFGTVGKSVIQSDMKLVRPFENAPANTLTAAEAIKTVEPLLSPVNKAILRRVTKLIDPKMRVQMLNTYTKKDAEILEVLRNARGWFSRNETDQAIYLLSPEFTASGLTPETLLHELLHAGLSRTITALQSADPNKQSKEEKELITSLQGIADSVNAYMEEHPELRKKFPVAKFDVHELISWGLSDAAFQEEVLSMIPSTPRAVRNGLWSKMTDFINAIGKFLRLTTPDGQYNALASLVQDTAQLIQVAEQHKQNPSGNEGTHSYAMVAIDQLSTEGIFDALDDQSLSPTDDARLRGLLTSIVTKLHGPYGSFKALIESNKVMTAKGLWDKAKRDGIAPFASSALAANIPMNEQVAFVLEQVEVTVQAVLDNNNHNGLDIVQEMSKLYREAAKTLKEDGSSFYQGDWATATQAEKDQAKELYDFLFKMDPALGGKSNHLARFAALGMVHPEIRKALKFDTHAYDASPEKTFVARLETFFQKVLSWFNGKLTDTHNGQRADEKLAALVNQLSNIEAKRKVPMKAKAEALVFIDDSIKKVTDKVRSGLEKAGRSGIIQNRSNAIIRAAGHVVSTVAGERSERVMEIIQKLRDRQITEGHGMAMSIANEIRGMHDGNKAFHKLIRLAKLREGTREDLIVHTGNVALESFANNGEDLTTQDKAAITNTVLRTDMSALLDTFTMQELHGLMADRATLNKEIAALENQLAAYPKAKGYYKRQAKLLAYKMAVGKVKGEHVLMNASAIASFHGTGLGGIVSKAEAAAATPLIDRLVSLRALAYTKPGDVALAAKVMAAEMARGNQNGIEMVLKLHRSMQQESKDRLFQGSELLMMKGYTPEMYDPRKEVLVATEAEGVELVAQGFSKGLRVSYDPHDPNKLERRVYTRTGGGLRPWLTGSISFTGETAKGSRSATENVKNLSEWKANQNDLMRIYREKQAVMSRLLKDDPTFDPEQVQENYAAPVINSQGDIADYRYLMSEEVKDALLNRDSRFDKVLGAYAGSIYDKESTKESNRKVIQALHDQYKVDMATKYESYRRVGMDSGDKELRDIYRMLPEDTKEAIREIWGTDYMLVRSDLMDITFGYRKVSLSNLFEKEKRGVIEEMFVGLMKHVMGGKAVYNVQRFEDVWQEIVGEIKDILVIKNLSTLLGNISSNVSLLFWQGVPLTDMAKYHRIAIRGVTQYRKDSAALVELETQLKAGYITTTKKQMEDEIIRLQDSLARNPVKELIDAGLMPSIVEDVSPEEDMYSYKSQLRDYVDSHTNKWNKHIIGAAKFTYMGKDTRMYKTLHHVTQLSDFVARYALYQHVTTRRENPLSKEDAVQLASDSFINYDLPTHRKLQYLNDMGFTPFTKYYLRIQKVIANLYANHPVRAMGMLVAENYFSQLPLLTESGFMHRIGNNPFNPGALGYPGVLDELATIKVLSSPFH